MFLHTPEKHPSDQVSFRPYFSWVYPYQAPSETLFAALWALNKNLTFSSHLTFAQLHRQNRSVSTGSPVHSLMLKYTHKTQCSLTNATKHDLALSFTEKCLVELYWLVSREYNVLGLKL